MIDMDVVLLNHTKFLSCYGFIGDCRYTEMFSCKWYFKGKRISSKPTFKKFFFLFKGALSIDNKLSFTEQCCTLFYNQSQTNRPMLKIMKQKQGKTFEN